MVTLLIFGVVHLPEIEAVTPPLDADQSWVALPGCTLGKTLAVMSPPPGKTTQNCHCWGFSGYICEPVPITLCPYGPTFQNRATPQTCTCTTPTSTSVYTCA
ncbi:uncharacterized protein LOC110848437 [Folsomia candida]|uniref:uncharacterized protein LOC110848437 n=1 Tax=Folsomia candida TaxID=158441 RepID=UPI000B902A34|nr:uncharacterized protein LOC110848437 [Folsomia candida]